MKNTFKWPKFDFFKKDKPEEVNDWEQPKEEKVKEIIMVEKQPKQKKRLTAKDKKIIKWSILGTSLATSGTLITIFTFDHRLLGATSEDAVWGFYIGFCLGFLFTLWYPATRLLAWMKTRQLKNKNLEKDLELKDAKIEALQSKKPLNEEE